MVFKFDEYLLDKFVEFNDSLIRSFRSHPPKWLVISSILTGGLIGWYGSKAVINHYSYHPESRQTSPENRSNLEKTLENSLDSLNSSYRR
jgi:hypothetical protein